MFSRGVWVSFDIGKLRTTQIPRLFLFASIPLIFPFIKMLLALKYGLYLSLSFFFVLKLAPMADKLIVLNPSRNNWGKNTYCLEASLEFFLFLGGGGGAGIGLCS